MSNTQQQVHVMEDNDLRITLHAHPAINLALVHNGVPLITGLAVVNESNSEVTDLVVTVHLHGRGEELTAAQSRTYDGRLGAGARVQWDDLGDVLPPVKMLQDLNESYQATITVTVASLWRDTTQLTVPIQVLAHNEWFNSPIFYDSLAAFVQPNTRAVVSVLDAAAELLRHQTGDSSLGGYQSGPERAALIAGAIYEALRSRRIRYIDPPASFENTGQKVRTTSQVLAERFGTCIDLSVTYAACLEAAGIRPLVWLVDGHAFAGFLRDETALPHPSLTEQNALVNLVESGIAVPVEACFYRSGEDGSFKAAVAAGHRHFADPSCLRGVLGVTAARKDGVRPLPSFDALPIEHAGQDTPIGTMEPAFIELPDELYVSRSDDELVLDSRDTAPVRVRKWKRALLDLSTRNRLLNLRPSSQVIDLHVPHSGLALLDDMAHDGKPLDLAASDDLSHIHQLQGARRAAEIEPELLLSYLRDDRKIYAAVTTESYLRRFKGLARIAHTMFEETGTSNLYLTFGALVHRTSTGVEARAPLFLLPVRITGGTGRSAFRIVVDTTGVASPNYCLVEWLRVKHNVTIEALQSPKLDHSGLDMAHALREIRAALVEHKLDLRVDEVAAVAICQFSTFGMWKDLSDHWDSLEQSPIVQHLTYRPGESFHDPRFPESSDMESIAVDETEIPVPIPADGSQLRAVAAAADGRTFVLEGPPGTGKSQTITNLIAHALDNGKSVLFVAEKQAALDVVKKRLTKIGLADFTLDLHGKSQSANAIREQLRRAIDNSMRYNQHGWTARIAEYRSQHAPLADYPSKIHSRNGVDHSLWRAFDTAIEVGQGPSAPIPAAYIGKPAVAPDEITRALEQFSRAARSVDIQSGSPWSIVGPAHDRLSAELLAHTATRLGTALAAACSSPAAWGFLQRTDQPGEVETTLAQARRQLGHVVPDPRILQWWSGTQFASARNALLAEIQRLHQNCAPLLATFTPLFLESGDISAFTAEAEEATKGMFGKKKRLEQFEHALAPFTTANADRSPAAIAPLLRAIPGARTHIARLRHEVAKILGPYTPPLWNPLTTDAATTLRPIFDYIGATVDFVNAEPRSWDRLVASGFPDRAGIDVLGQVGFAWQEWQSLLATGVSDFARWRGDTHWLHKWQKDEPHWSHDAASGAAKMLGWARMVGFLEPLRRAGLDAFVDDLLTGRIAAADAVIAFIRGTAQASIAERRAAGGITGFDASLRDGEIEDFARTAEALRTEQCKALPAALLARRPFQAGALKGEPGELRRQLDRKRGGATFRQLMTRYGKHILAATPCMFVSPASLAQFVPPGSVTFDIVVFDEASQVTVPQAIGALGRGRSAIIVGDSQQMPPTTIGQVTIEDDDEADESGVIAPDDLDSILTECVESGVPRLWLSWHYRSQDETLITFSNTKYYGGRLASLPSPGGDNTAGIEWRRVDGHFNREDRRNRHRTNRVEAEAIVQEIRTRLATPHLADQSIGVVTFNKEQQTLVQDLLDECSDPLVLDRIRPEDEEAIFVKNLENIQGDERDVILFSTAFSKKPGDNRLPLNFGPLIQSGGEKRFNVAITRARRKVLVFTSFDPTDIDLSRTRSVGLAHLRAYLEMAAREKPTVPAPAPRSESGDTIGETIAESLRVRGYQVAIDFGLSEFVLDLVVRDPSSPRWQVAILLDGPRWADRPTVSDRDLTPRLLERLLHWGSSLRIWLPEWIDAPDRVLDQVDAAMVIARERHRQFENELAAQAQAQAAAIAATIANDSVGTEADPDAEVDPAEAGTIWDSAQADSPKPADPPAVAMVARIADPAQVAPPDFGQTQERDWHGRPATYISAPTTPLGDKTDLDRLNSRSVRDTIVAAARVTVEAEGPIALDRLARDIGHRFGYGRVAAGRKDFIIRCVPGELIRSSELGDFVWPRQIDQQAWRGFRSTPDDLTRPLAEIAPEEIANAMITACKGRALDEETLARETMTLFGQRRLTAPSHQRLQKCIEFGVASGRLLRVDGLIRAGV